MLKYIKIGDDDAEKLNAKDALLLWVQNKTAGYKDVNVSNFKSSFKDGLALCAVYGNSNLSILTQHPDQIERWITNHNNHFLTAFTSIVLL